MKEKKDKIRVVLGKVGLDTHDRGMYVLSQLFRDAGIEVIFLGRFQTAEKIVKTALEEDVDFIALSDHAGVMLEIAKDVINAAKKLNAEDIPIVAGGFIPEDDIPLLEKMGVTGNFGAYTPDEEIIDHIQKITNKTIS